MLEIKEVNKFYNSRYGWVQALKNVSLQIPRGEIIGLFGENGAGKSTLFQCILGFERYKGEITLDGEKITHKNIEKLSFATCEHSFFPNLTPGCHADFYALQFPNFRNKRFELLMDFFELPMRKAISSYSTGQKNQFEVVMALSQGADYILMDEPFAGNDIFNREDFYRVLLSILEPNETVVLSTHLIEEVENFVGRAILIKQGQVIGDRSTLELEEQGQTLVSYIKDTYGYRADRVSKVLEELM
ncbi:MAG: ABC transporter ATP-binding protein [Lachnospiraceae bacterium]|nr:ABC transporter ATP-binding protein [Lachnospiraceae bacterium]